jgi:hypothetical protein
MSSVTIDLHQEKTYLVRAYPVVACVFVLNREQIDFSRELIRWISEEKYALIDVNLTEKLPKTPVRQLPSSPAWTKIDQSRRVVRVDNRS